MSKLKSHTTKVIAPIFFQVCAEIGKTRKSDQVNVNVKQDTFYVKEAGDGATSVIQRMNEILYENRKGAVKRHPVLQADLVVAGVLRSCSRGDFIVKESKREPLRRFLRLTVAVRPDVRDLIGSAKAIESMSGEKLAEAYDTIRMGVIDIEDYYLHRNCTTSKVLRYADTAKATAIAVVKLESPLATYRVTISGGERAVTEAMKVIDAETAKVERAKKKSKEQKAKEKAKAAKVK